MRYIIGIDTGGTYTDAMILDAQSRDVLATAKAVTTRGDLVIGVNNALTRSWRVSALTSSAPVLSVYRSPRR